MELEDGLDLIAEVVGSGARVREGTVALIDSLEVAVPGWNGDWLRSLDFAADIERIRVWFTELLATEPVPPHIRAYWFGIINPEVDGAVSCGFYVSGSPAQYTEDDPDWAVWTDVSYLPVGRYAPSDILPALFQSAQGIDPDPAVEYVLCLGYVSLVVSDLMRHTSPALTGSFEPRAVVAGFDDGDSVYLGTITEVEWLTD